MFLFPTPPLPPATISQVCRLYLCRPLFEERHKTAMFSFYFGVSKCLLQHSIISSVLFKETGTSSAFRVVRCVSSIGLWLGEFCTRRRCFFFFLRAHKVAESGKHDTFCCEPTALLIVTRRWEVSSNLRTPACLPAHAFVLPADERYPDIFEGLPANAKY